MTPRIGIPPGDFGELGVELCGFAVVVLDRLAAIGAEGVFVEGVELDGVADGVFCAEAWMAG